MSRAGGKPEGFQFVIEPTHGWMSVDYRELWEHRELLFLLAWRDVIVRYKQSLFGVAWVIIQPVLAMVVFSLIFGQLAKLPSDGIPYAVFSYSALLPWQLITASVTRSANSLVINSSLVTKVYFPRLLMPIAAVFAGLVDFAVSLLVLFGFLVAFRINPGWPILTLPLFVLLALVTALAFGIWLAALNVRYRDVTYILPFLIQMSLYLSPVAYSSKLIPSGIWRSVYALNPLVGVIQGFRWALVKGPAPDASLLLSTTVTLVLLVAGVYYFRRTEKTFADIV